MAGSAATVAVVLAVALAAAGARPAAGQRAADGPLDRILDLYVRDGLVYYRALRAERAVLDRYVRALRDVPAGFDGWSTGQRVAFWLNSYNALVLRTVVDHYPIRGDFPLFPADSIRQIPGAFDDIRHAVAGRALTLDAIESSVLASFGDPPGVPGTRPRRRRRWSAAQRGLFRRGASRSN